ncbi:hypothetical protein GCK72_026101 [Caenorhabditis remanei]|uniref:C2H2-type domain-containing protein n=1 Tax=Caenorhabditis remanei TaxID=31234 RepID=A0A6A5G496_CAERE|nr:hypothetical protein GCK72_026101 [Caenorhabditis remanei]KAF1749633.1 hypothetical protein GCK72_026101 [Caenorhabditis remanei]
MEVHTTRLMAQLENSCLAGTSPLGRTSMTQEFDGRWLRWSWLARKLLFRWAVRNRETIRQRCQAGMDNSLVIQHGADRRGKPPGKPVRDLIMSDDHFKCEICRKSFGIAALRDEHQRSHHKKSYRCDECGKRQWLWSNVTIQEEFNCNICQESRSSLKALQMHFKKRHFGNKNSQEFLNAWNVCSGEKPPKNPAVHQRRKDKRE